MTRLLRSLQVATAGLACAVLAHYSMVSASDVNTTDTSVISRALSSDAEISARAIAELRMGGQPSVTALCEAYRNATAESGQLPNDATLLRWRNVIDAVAQQKDAHASGLYWHTEFETALSEAQRTGRPILSLRLLGNLNEDRSCANSRFFRTVLYANESVSQHLRNHFVLHWQSLRPVPNLTIDFGDGRRIERTITGNSIHYVLDSNGELIDAIPGLYAPGAFLETLLAAERIAEMSVTTSSVIERTSMLREFHASALKAISTKKREDLARLNDNAGRPLIVVNPIAAPAGAGGPPDANRAAVLSMSKSRIEQPTLRAMNNVVAEPMTTPVDESLWPRLAALHRDEAVLDEASIALMRAKSRPKSDMREGDLFPSMLETFRTSLAADTVRNEYEFHRAIHHWLAVAPASIDVTAFNERVYAELFLTPLDDPWMGLAPANVYSALDDCGLCDTH